MLHLERYTKGVKESIGILEINKEKPDNLIDPTPLLLKLI